MSSKKSASTKEEAPASPSPKTSAKSRKAQAALEAHQGFLLVISGPAGVGKDTVWKAASAKLPTFRKALTCTTRPRRAGEEEGVHYHFVGDEEFDRMIHADELLEWAFVHGHRYGVPWNSVVGRLTEGQDVVCVIDVQGAQRIRGIFPTALLVFITPPAGREEDVLKERIVERGGADEAEIATRIRTAFWELTHIPLYDHQIVNDEVERAAEELRTIVLQEKEKRAVPENHVTK